MIKKIVNIIFVATIFFVANSLSSAQAQIYQSPVNVNSGIMTQRIMTQNNINAAMISGMIRSNMMNSSMRKGSKTSNGRTARQTPSDPFDYSPAGANSIVRQLALQLSEKGNQRQQEEAEQIFQQALKLYRETSAKDGVRSNNLVSAFEYFLVNNYHIYYNVFGDLGDSIMYDSSKIPNFISSEQEETLYKQFRQMFASNDTFKKLTDKEKQQATETLAIMTNIPWFMYETGLKNEDSKLVKQARTMAKENLENIFGTPAGNIIVNDYGISFKK